MKRTAYRLLKKLRKVECILPCFPYDEERLVFAVDAIALADAREVKLDGVHRWAWFTTLPGFRLCALIGPDVLRFYVARLIRHAYPGQTTNLREFAGRLVMLYGRKNGTFTYNMWRFKDAVRDFAAWDVFYD